MVGVVILVTLVACGGGSATVDASGRRTPRPAPIASVTKIAPTPPPTAELPVTESGVESPPPAWIQTASGSQWMDYGTYCWDETCALYVAPSERDDLPVVEVRPGEEVTFHLGFDPAGVELSFDPKNPSRIRLRRQRDVTWRVTRGGDLSLSTRSDPHGDAMYHVRLVVRGASASSGP